MSTDETTSPITARFEAVVSELTALRDEVRLQADLAGMELRDAVAAAEVKLQQTQSKLKAATAEVEEKVPELKASATALADDVRKALEDVRTRLTGS